MKQDDEIQVAKHQTSPTLFVDSDESIDKASPLATGFNIMKTTIGAGIFCTAAALNAGGFVYGNVIIIIMAFVFYWTIMTLVASAHLSQTANAQALAKYCFGVWGERVMNLVIFLLAWGSVAVYTLYMADVIPDFLFTYVHSESPVVQWLISRRGVVITTSVMLFPICLARSMKGLAKFSSLALVAIFFIICCILAIGPTLDSSVKGNDPIVYIRYSGMHTAISILSFGFVCQHSLLLNYHQMRNKNLRVFGNVTKVSLGIACTLTVMVGLAYLTFREKSETNIINNFSKDNIIMNVCRLLFGVNLFLSYPLGLYCVRDTVTKALFYHKFHNTFRHVIITILVIISSCALACLTCDLGFVVEISGGISASLLAYVIPGACWIKCNELQGTPLPFLRKLGHLLCMGFGIALLGMTVWMTVYNQIHARGPAKDCRW